MTRRASPIAQRLSSRVIPRRALKIEELEEFGRRAELVGRSESERRCGDLGSVLLRFERYLTIHFEKADF